MSDLSQLQQDFQNYMLRQDPFIQKEIISTEKVSAITRLDIYRDAYYLRLLEALSHDYPALHVLMGDEEFDRLGRSYIDAHPSRFRSVRWFGDNIADFMQKTALYSDHSLLSEMARFEWLVTEAFDARDVAVVSLEDMAAVPFEQWPEMRFVFHPAFRRSQFQWNIVPLWTAIREEKTPVPQMAEEKIDWMFWRKAMEVQFCSLSVDEAFVVDAMRAGENFGEICEGLCEWIEPEQVAMHAASLLKRFVVDELITEVL